MPPAVAMAAPGACVGSHTACCGRAVTAPPVAAKPHGGRGELTFAGASGLQDGHCSPAWKQPPHHVDICPTAQGTLSAGQRASEIASVGGSQASDPGLSHGRRPGTGKPSSPGGQSLRFFSGRTWKHSSAAWPVSKYIEVQPPPVQSAQHGPVSSGLSALWSCGHRGSCRDQGARDHRSVARSGRGCFRARGEAAHREPLQPPGFMLDLLSPPHSEHTAPAQAAAQAHPGPASHSARWGRPRPSVQTRLLDV